MRPPFTFGLTLAAALASACMLVACGKPPGGPPPAQGTPEVGVVTVQPQRVAITAELPGRTTPFLIADVRPQVGGIVVVLLAHRLDGDQFLVALGLEPRGLQAGLRLGERGDVAVVAGLVGGGVDLVERLSLIHI